VDDEGGFNSLFMVKDSGISKQSQIPAAIDAGKIYYGASADKAKKVTKELINSLWDKKYSLLTRSGDLDWTKNCADYATGEEASRTHKGIISATKDYLGEHYTDVGSVDEPDKSKLTVKLTGLAVGEYVVTGASHFVKLEVKVKGSSIAVSEKDGESAIYSASGGPDTVAAILCLSFEYSCTFYKKKS
jgi:hypothetical protein